MIALLKNMFIADKNKKVINKMNETVKKINSLEESYINLSDDQLKAKTTEFKERLNSQKDTLDTLLPEAFAVVREAAKRMLGQRHYDVQLIGGITLHSAMIAEMATGEGKTLVSTLPVYLNALAGKGVHVITVNEYLAKRDSAWMGQIYEFLGLTVGCLHDSMNDEEKKAAYNADITYGTNNEFGFDYLRDNMKLEKAQLVQRDFYYAVVDEIDSILIDEARTPLVISGQSEDKTHLYKEAGKLVKNFNKEEHFEIDEKQKNINMTEEGIDKAEEILQKSGLIKDSGSLFDSENNQLYHTLVQAIKAHYLFTRDKDYIVKDGELIIIDEFTGRMMEGRRYSDGLHQSLEVKEGLKVKRETQTLASITYQNYFRMYPKLSGMTGTAATEAKEFLEIYNLNIVSIPTNYTVQRKDYNDQIYLKYKNKEDAIVENVKKCYEKGQPVLIGTVSIEKSELLSKALKKAKVPHNVLNAKHHEKEAEIIAFAGVKKAVTIATNMAGRGTDIQLGGSIDLLAIKKGYHKLEKAEQLAKIEELKKELSVEKEEILALGGLCVIGTERHESRRIDNQLRGRSGRQGEAGTSVFFVSLEDDLMRIFASSRLEGTLKKLGFKDNEAISHSMITKSIEKAQKRVEAHNFDIRKTLLKFDNVINEQRKVIYSQRKEIMNKTIDPITLAYDSIEKTIENNILSLMPENEYREKWNIKTISMEIQRVLNVNPEILNLEKVILEEALSLEEIKNLIVTEANKKVQEKIDLVKEEAFSDIMKSVALQVLDITWKKHLLELDYIRGSITLRAYANKDPFNEYQRESYQAFTNMLDNFNEQLSIISTHLRIEMNENVKKS